MNLFLRSLILKRIIVTFFIMNWGFLGDGFRAFGQNHTPYLNKLEIPKTLELGTSDGLLFDFSIESLKNAKQSGVNFLEISLTKFIKLKHEERVQLASMIRENSQKTGVQLWSVHLPYGNDFDVSNINEVERKKNVKTQKEFIDIAELLGVKRMVLHPSVDRITSSVRQLHIEALRESLLELQDYLKGKSVSLNIENLPRACLGNSIEEMAKILEGIPNIGICADVNHMKGVKPEDFISFFGKRIKMVHMSDYDFVDEKHWLPGWGDNNWNNIILSLIEAGYDGPFMYEVIKPFTSIEGLKDNYKNLMNNFKGWIRNI